VRPTLFYLPQQIGPLPLFGWGWVLIVWALGTSLAIAWAWRHEDSRREIVGQLPFIGLVALVIVVVLPHLQIPGRGLAIRGYGLMMLLGVVSGVTLAARRAWQMRLTPDVIYSLALWMFVAGIVGARLFFVIEYWPTFAGPSTKQTLLAIVNFTKGGLVVYGSVIGGLAAGAWFLVRRGLPPLAMADLVAPSLTIGLTLGRIGCLMNGCCFGGLCESSLPSQHFPAGSPPYMQQLYDGRLLGMSFREVDRRTLVVTDVVPGGLAERSGIQTGERLSSWPLFQGDERGESTLPTAERLEQDMRDPQDSPVIVLVRRNGKPPIEWSFQQLPKVSLPVHPAQLYAAFNALLLTILLWLLMPVRRYDGVVFATLFTLYPISRFLLEIIRSDERGQFGTALTISQWISLAALAGTLLLWLFVLKIGRPATQDFSAFDTSPAANA
jgi:phosphatidylglycerol---prolipoprotein diacylglyceryl transferase